jgi:hypothetical protein
VPKLPRGRGMRWMWADLFRIGFLLIMLLAIISMRETCSQGVAGFFGQFDVASDAAPAVPEGYELLTPERAAELFPVYDAGPTAGDGAPSPAH